MLGLPDEVTACLFDLDGVLTRTAEVHARAWKEMFDTFLGDRRPGSGEDLSPFDVRRDYGAYVDGRPRLEGVRAFLDSRHISLPEGDVDDPPDRDTLNGLGNRKNEAVLAHIHRDGVAVFDGSVRYLRAAAEAGLRRAVVSSSTNTADVLAVTGLDRLIEVRVDGVVARQRGLAGKPSPDTFLAAAAELGVAPSAAAVFEDALAGVEAGRAGGFGAVIGVDRLDQAAALADHGATRVVSDLDQLLDGA